MKECLAYANDIFSFAKNAIVVDSQSIFNSLKDLWHDQSHWASKVIMVAIVIGLISIVFIWPRLSIIAAIVLWRGWVHLEKNIIDDDDFGDDDG